MNHALKDALESNQSKPCSVEGCSYLRYRLYSTCVHHFFRRKLYGNAKSKAIKKSELQRDRDVVTRLVERNESHQGIQKAITWLDQWLKEATESKPVPGARHLQRLAYNGINGRDLLITCGALWAYSYRKPQFFPDKLSLVYGLAHQVMTLAPLEYATTEQGRNALWS